MSENRSDPSGISQEGARPKIRGYFSAAFVDGAVIALSKEPSDVWQLLSFLASYIAAILIRLRPRPC